MNTRTLSVALMATTLLTGVARAQTPEPIPDELITRLHQARQFNQGYETVRYAASALVDMAVHALPDAEPPADLCAFEADLLAAQSTR